MYDKLNWQDEVKDQDGTIIQKGTPLSSKNMNNMENGIYAANAIGSMLVQRNLQQDRVLGDLEGEVGKIALTNSDEFPFNNSIKTVSMEKQRDTLSYRIATEVLAADGDVGNVTITDKQLNGFKINYTGSANKVTVKYYIQGGMYQ